MLEAILKRFRPKHGALVLLKRMDDGTFQWLDLGERNQFNLNKRRNNDAVIQLAIDRLTTIVPHRSIFNATTRCDFVSDETVYEVVEFAFDQALSGVYPEARGQFDIKLRQIDGYAWKSLDSHPEAQAIISRLGLVSA